MVWEISISDEGWEDIRKELYKKTRNWMIKALVADQSSKAEIMGMKADPHSGAYDKNEALIGLGERLIIAGNLRKHRAYLGADLDKEQLVEQCIDIMEENNTCENGGWEYWIDKEGFYTIILGD